VTGKAGRRPYDPVGQVAAETRIASRARQPQTGVRVPVGAPARQGPPWRAGAENGPDWLAAGRIFRQRTQAVAVSVGIQ
jgi:hypothetical protein